MEIDESEWLAKNDHQKHAELELHWRQKQDFHNKGPFTVLTNGQFVWILEKLDELKQLKKAAADPGQ